MIIKENKQFKAHYIEYPFIRISDSIDGYVMSVFNDWAMMNAHSGPEIISLRLESNEKISIFAANDSSLVKEGISEYIGFGDHIQKTSDNDTVWITKHKSSLRVPFILISEDDN